MPSYINSTTTGSGGLITTAGADNQLVIQTGDTAAITIDSAQQVTVAANITASYFIGNGSQLTGISAGISTGKAIAMAIVFGG